MQKLMKSPKTVLMLLECDFGCIALESFKINKKNIVELGA